VAGSVIGIKIADGSFFPVFERSHTGKKKLVLTTVNDNQDSVQIDLYQGEGESMDGAEYIGSLVVGSIQPASKGEPEINLVLGIDGEGNLNATATDEATGEYESLSVSLESLEEDLYTLPDFQLEEEPLGDAEQLNDFDLEDDFGEELEESLEPPSQEESISTAAASTAAPASTAPAEEDEEAPIAYSRPAEPAPRRRGHTLLFIGFMILSLAALAFLVYFMFRMLRGPDVPPLEARLHMAGLVLLPMIFPRIGRGARRHRTRIRS
jgi:hypothetical protein